MKKESLKHGNERKIICDDPPAEIFLPDQLLEVPPSVSENSLRKAEEFCQKRQGALQKEPDKNHRKAVGALGNKAPEIYTSRFLLPEETPEELSRFPPIQAFSEVALGARRDQERVDLVLLGPGGVYLTEVKPPGISANPQLEKYQDTWRRRFPDVPCSTIKATYWAEGKKIKIALSDQEL